MLFDIRVFDKKIQVSHFCLARTYSYSSWEAYIKAVRIYKSAQFNALSFCGACIFLTALNLQYIYPHYFKSFTYLGTVEETSWDHILFTQCNNRHLDEKHFQEKKIVYRLDNWKDDSWRDLINQYKKNLLISSSRHWSGTLYVALFLMNMIEYISSAGSVVDDNKF